MYLNHFVIHLKLTQYCKSTIFPFKKKKIKDSFTIQFPQKAVLFC